MKSTFAKRIDLSGVGFARLDEYFGFWAMEPSRFRLAWDRASQMDLKAHVAHAAQTTPAKAQIGTAVVPVADNPSSFGGNTSGNILIVKASGVLMKQVPSGEAGSSTIMLRRVLREAAADDTIAGIILVIDSPGGTVSGTSDLAADTSQVAQNKPVWAYIEDLGASAAYWWACTATRIIANHRTAAVGSIGTILGLYDTSEAAAKEGIEAVVISTGDLKGAGFPGAPIGPEQRAYFQKIIDATQTSFAQAVTDGRGLSAEAVAELSTGAVWLADEALELGLIDSIASLDQTIADMRDFLASENDINNNTGGAAASQQLENQTMSKTRTEKLAARTNPTDLQATGKASDEEEKKPVQNDKEKQSKQSASDDKPNEPDAEEGSQDDQTPCDCEGEEDCDCDNKPAEPESEDGEDDKPAMKPAAKSTNALSAKARATEGQKFITAFGDQGAIWYAQGKSFAQAKELHTQALIKENADLKAQMAGVDRGASKALKITGEQEKPKANEKLAREAGDGVARVAAGMKMPGR